MPTWSDQLLGEGFQLVSALHLGPDGKMRLLHWKKCDGAGAPLCTRSLYVFVDTNADAVLYVGKAGKGWSARRPQHNGGYAQAQKGRTSANHQNRIAELRSLVEKGAKIAVYERAVPPLADIDREEYDLIQHLRPHFNIKGKIRRPKFC